MEWHDIFVWKKTLIKYRFGKIHEKKLMEERWNVFQIQVRIVYTDTSETRFGGYCVQTGSAVSHGIYEKHKRRKSSTLRELMDDERGLRSLFSFLEVEIKVSPGSLTKQRLLL